MNLRHLGKLDLENSQTSLFHFTSTPAALSDGCLQFLTYQSNFCNKIMLSIKCSICQAVTKSSLWACSTMECVRLVSSIFWRDTGGLSLGRIRFMSFFQMLSHRMMLTLKDKIWPFTESCISSRVKRNKYF